MNKMELDTKFSSPEYELEQPYDTLAFDNTEVAATNTGSAQTPKKSKQRICLIAKFTLILVAAAAIASALGVSLSPKEQSSDKAAQSGTQTCSHSTLDGNLFFFDITAPKAGDVFTVSCANNTKLVGSSEVICLSSGKWNNEPHCEKLRCPVFVLPENTIDTAIQESDIGTSIRVFCQDGFILKGNETVICMPNENWSPLPQCEAIDCGIPPYIPNGNITELTGTSFNSTLQIGCDEGFEHTGSSPKLFCNTHGQWEGSPKCSHVNCGLPDIPENGSIVAIDGFEYQDKVYLKCFDAFSLRGNNPVSCLSNGSWSMSPQCVTKGCGIPKPVANGTILHTTSTNINSSFLVVCNEGFSLSGAKFITCSPDGIWTRAPTCHPVPCGELILPSNTYLVYSDGTTFGSSAKVRCGNFEGNHTELVTCTSKAEWSNLPYCGCEVPENITNGQIQNLTTTDINGTFLVACYEGYEVKGSKDVQCDTNGRWTRFPTCEIVSCGEFTPENNSFILATDGTTLNSTAQIQCNVPNYTTTVICTSNGNWSPQPACGLLHNCRDYRNRGFYKSGVYVIRLWKSEKRISVYCDMDTDGGGWTVFQNRFNGSVDFYRTFADYENGFGSLTGEFWLGLQYIQEMTDPEYGSSELRLDMSAADGSTAYEVFKDFFLSSGQSYTLRISNGTGTAGDKHGLSYSRGRGFSTFDRGITSCAQSDRGGWWYYGCAYANLNGEYVTPGTRSLYHNGEGGMTYRDFQGVESLKTSKMMFRRTS